MLEIVSSVWRFRFFVLSSVKAELLSRIARSRLGVLWLIIPPLSQVAIFSLILSQVMAAKLPGIDSLFSYSIYLMAGILSWTLFTEIMSRSLTVFIDNATILKKIMFPKVALPLILYGVAAINNAILLAAIMAAFVLMGHLPSATILWLPLIAAICSLLALSLGVILGILNVFIRDVGQFTTIALQVWFWFTPIVYLPEILPEKVRWIIAVNPMAWIVGAYHDVLVYKRTPDLGALFIVSLVVALLTILALLIYRRASPDMVDVL
jgi:lipopolysaccharide transport system permease protein